MSSTVISIDGRKIGEGQPPYVIAELSGNHNGDISRALRLIDSAKAAGADAVKLQTYTADTITLDCDRPDFLVKGGLWDGRRLYDLYKEASTPWDWHEAIFKHAREIGITCFSSPFDFTAVEFLEQLDTPAYKIASFELVDTSLIERVAACGKPMILSTGMASYDEIDRAMEAVGDVPFALLHCVSGYPTPFDQANLMRIRALMVRYGCLVGLSDHTLGVEVAVAAAALGASIIEKHITLARADGGVDAAFSLEPEELRRLVEGVRIAFEAVQIHEGRPASEEGNVQFRRSLYVVADMRAGEVFTPDNVRSIRPGYGLVPRFYKDVLGKTAVRDIARGEALTGEMLA